MSLARIWAIALNTFREAARIRVLYGILVLVLGSNLLAVFVGELSWRDADRFARDIGLAGISLFGSLTAIFLGVFLLYTEVQRRTIHAIVSKPISRWEFVVGKYAGMAIVLSVLVGVFAAAMLGMLVWQHTEVSAGVV
jgi:ABC-type transport system involved in multi-copper enzyme maturation permease subunit